MNSSRNRHIMYLDVEVFSMDEAERQIFGSDALTRARESTLTANSVIPDIIRKEDWFNSSARRLFEDNLSELEVDVGNYTFTPGGHWKPNHCTPKWKVAVIIPFRNRSYHLPILLRYLVPMLQKQHLEFGVFVANQENNMTWNKGILMNMGFLESMNFSSWDCFVFHDVDHVPLSELNYYGCDNMPRHFLTGDSMWNYTLLYKKLFGGVTGFYESNIWKFNGFPNVYWGWGGEDDEIYRRVIKAKLRLGAKPTGKDRYIGFYKAIEHHHASAPKIPERYVLLKNYKKRIKTDGLSNLRYPAPRIEIHSLYVNLSVDIFKFD